MYGGLRLATHLCMLFNLFLVYSFVPDSFMRCTSWSPWKHSGRWKGRTMEKRICGKDEFSARSEREKK